MVLIVLLVLLVLQLRSPGSDGLVRADGSYSFVGSVGFAT